MATSGDYSNPFTGRTQLANRIKPRAITLSLPLIGYAKYAIARTKVSVKHQEIKKTFPLASSGSFTIFRHVTLARIILANVSWIWKVLHLIYPVKHLNITQSDPYTVMTVYFANQLDSGLKISWYVLDCLVRLFSSSSRRQSGRYFGLSWLSYQPTIKCVNMNNVILSIIRSTRKTSR